MFIFRSFFLVLFVFFISLPVARAADPSKMEFLGNAVACIGNFGDD